MNKKYLPSALILYLNYFIHGVGCSILGQAVIKEALAAAWGVEAMAITAISAVSTVIIFLNNRSLQSEDLLPPRGVAASGFPPLCNIPHCCLP